jgi:integrase
MPRKASIWTRKGRTGWYATINGRQIPLGDDRKEAERLFHELKAAGRPVPRSSLTVGTLVDQYLDAIRSEVRETTWANYRWYLLRWYRHAGDKRAAAVKPYDVREWLATECPRRVGDKNRKGWTTSTRHVAVSIVRQWSAWCQREGHLDTDPLVGVKRPPCKTREAAPPADLERFIAAIDDDRLRDYCLLLLDTGCRPGEIQSLEASQVDWDNSSATVRGKTGLRTVSLTSRAVEILRRLAAIHSSGPLLRNESGKAWTRDTSHYRFVRLNKLLGTLICAYHFRHDFFRRASKAGVDSLTIAAQLGHKNLNMLHKTYAHINASQTKRAVDLAMFGDAVQKEVEATAESAA